MGKQSTILSYAVALLLLATMAGALISVNS
jgi:hypothetical protein